MEKPFVWAVLLYLPAGLNLTYASTFQMLRGAVVIFTGLLSVAFLNRRLRVYQWWGIFLVFLGLIVVGLADVIAPPSDQKSQNINNIITGKEWMYVLLYYCTNLWQIENLSNEESSFCLYSWTNMIQLP